MATCIKKFSNSSLLVKCRASCSMSFMSANSSNVSSRPNAVIDILSPCLTGNVELLGGWTLANPEREDVQDAAKEAVEVFNTKSKAKKYFKLINVTSASTQVTNKINYKIEATIGKTKCHKSENTDIQACGMAKKQLTCKFEVTLDAMTDDHEVQKMSCRRSA
uniref:Si:busm1-57f23.1 n=1 Tax=Sinocyclocheilus grahami TaxID=75366 RepID=A0A672JUY1_SINGR